MKVDVTQEDIDRGEPGNGYECALALALNRETGETWLVGANSASMVNGHSIYLPWDVQRWLSQFDADKSSVQATSFSLIG